MSETTRQLKSLSQNVDTFSRRMEKQAASHESKAAEAEAELGAKLVEVDVVGEAKRAADEDGAAEADASKELYVMKSNISELLANMQAEVNRQNAAAEPKGD